MDCSLCMHVDKGFWYNFTLISFNLSTCSICFNQRLHLGLEDDQFPLVLISIYFGLLVVTALTCQIADIRALGAQQTTSHFLQDERVPLLNNEHINKLAMDQQSTKKEVNLSNSSVVRCIQCVSSNGRLFKIYSIWHMSCYIIFLQYHWDSQSITS